MNKGRLGITIFSGVLFVLWFFKLDFNDLSYKNNSTEYLGMMIMLLLLVFGIIQIYKNKE